MRGRKPKPTHLKLIDGNPGKRAINKNEPIPIKELSEAPDFLSLEQTEVWEHVIANAPAGMLKELDRELLYAWVAAAVNHRDAQREIREHGQFVHSKKTGYSTANPASLVAKRAVDIMTRVAAELGFSPSSRSRMQVAPNRAHETAYNPFDRFKAT
jgi:P27 family predicted phage terminase small subunit